MHKACHGTPAEVMIVNVSGKNSEEARLTEIDGVGSDTDVKPQHRYVTCPPQHRCLDFFYNNTNYFVQLEDTTIKTERCCSMQRTKQMRVCITAV